MNRLNLKAASIVLLLAFSVAAEAEGISKDDYALERDRISADYKIAKAGCTAFSDNTYDICDAKARGAQNVAEAELQVSDKPTTKNIYKLGLARADADYSVASQICDDRSGNLKDVCIKEAKAARISAKADAKATMTSTDANNKAEQTANTAQNQADDKSATARQDATSEKLEAEYTVAKEKCDTYAGAAKEVCLDRARIRFGKS